MQKQYKYKTQADLLAQTLGTIASETRARVQALVVKNMLASSSETPNEWYKRKIGSLTAFQRDLHKIILEGNKRLKNELKESQTDVMLTIAQVNELVGGMNQSASQMYKVSVDMYRQLTAKIYAETKSTTKTLQEIISLNQKGITNVGVVEYDDGSKRTYDSYMEMKVRTDIHHDIAENMIKSGAATGIAFYLCSYYGDCAEDHADYQGKIYIDENWRSIIPEDKHSAVEDYIDANKILTMQEVMDDKPYLTTRPNCRHFFQAISTDVALGLTSEKELNEQREKMGINANGKYDPDNYKALQQQRAYERQIRGIKAEKLQQQALLGHAVKTGDKEAQMAAERQIANCNRALYGYTDSDGEKHPGYFKQQRELMDEYPALQRNHQREQVGFSMNLGIRR